jgi:hypothetical protein
VWPDLTMQALLALVAAWAHRDRRGPPLRGGPRRRAAAGLAPARGGRRHRPRACRLRRAQPRARRRAGGPRGRPVRDRRWCHAAGVRPVGYTSRGPSSRAAAPPTRPPRTGRRSRRRWSTPTRISRPETGVDRSRREWQETGTSPYRRARSHLPPPCCPPPPPPSSPSPHAASLAAAATLQPPSAGAVPDAGRAAGSASARPRRRPRRPSRQRAAPPRPSAARAAPRPGHGGARGQRVRLARRAYPARPCARRAARAGLRAGRLRGPHLSAVVGGMGVRAFTRERLLLRADRPPGSPGRARAG